MANPRLPVYLVGSIPLTRAYDVFTTCAELLGPQLARIPDGEIGDRMMWVQAQYAVMASNPAFELAPFPAEGLTRKTGYQIPLRLRAGTDAAALTLGELGYARHAIASYSILRRLKDAGRVPAQWRLQVGVPAPMDAMSMVEPPYRAAVEAAFERALLGEIARIQAAIPHDELAITIDAVQGVLLWEQPDNRYVTLWFEDPLSGVVDRLARVAAAVAPKVELGLHLCYGSQDHKHALEPKDLGACVRLAMAVAGRLGRPVDYLHVPVPRERKDVAYFAPLRDLDRGRVRQIYLGLVHYTDAVAGARERIAAAAQATPDFGIATECGFGRRPSHQDIRRLIALHAEI